MMSKWTQEQRQIAMDMRQNGASSREIGDRVGRTAAAVRTMLSDVGASPKRSEWIDQFGGPIETCDEHRRLIKNAVQGSAMLRDALFGMVA